MRRRRWTVRCRRLDGKPVVITVQVPDDGTGRIFACLSSEARGVECVAVFDPEDLSRLRRAFLQAMTRALRDRGSW